MAGTQFNYRLTESAEEGLKQAEATPAGQDAARALAPFEKRACELLQKDVRELEVAATIAYYRSKGSAWEEAVRSTCRLKSLKPESQLVNHAASLAREAGDRNTNQR